MTSEVAANYSSGLADVRVVVADPLRFKRQLRMGEDTYKLMRTRKRLQELWDVGGMASTGVSIAASKFVATTFFASTGSALSFLGIGAAAATPIGWVIAAGAASGGLYYGLTRWVAQKSPVDVVPHFINTPLDLLAMGLLDMVGALALAVAKIDGRVTQKERRLIAHHLVDDWGYHPTYVDRALAALEKSTGQFAVKDIARSLAQFQAANPDCNADLMQRETLAFLEAVIAADGKLDERERLAVDAIAATFLEERKVTFEKVGRAVSEAAGDTQRIVREAVGGLAARVKSTRQHTDDPVGRAPNSATRERDTE